MLQHCYIAHTAIKKTASAEQNVAQRERHSRFTIAYCMMSFGCEMLPPIAAGCQ